MQDSRAITFETPENVEVSYEPAGLGSRFIAWFIDSFILSLLMLVMFILLAALGALSGEVADWFGEVASEAIEAEQEGYGGELVLQMYLWGIVTLIGGLGSFLYFGILEYAMDGRTFGKKWLSLRVVKTSGFTLDAGSVFIRNIFRIVDQVTLLWIVPIISGKSQRLGDMAAGTVVIRDKPRTLSRVREELLLRPKTSMRHRFQGTQLAKLDKPLLEAVEQFLDRYDSLEESQKRMLSERLAHTAAMRMGLEPPEPGLEMVFLVDAMAQLFQRQAENMR